MTSSEDDEEFDSHQPLQTLNISNDEYYQPKPGAKIYGKARDIVEKLEIPKYGSPYIQHSLPAYDLWRPFYPTYMSEEKFRNFHRPKLRHYTSGPQARLAHRRPKPIPVKNLASNIHKFRKKLCRDIVRAINNDMSRQEICNRFLTIRKARELTAKYGDVFLFEYSEELPPVLSQIGMAANIKTYQQRNPNLPKSKLAIADANSKIGYDEVISSNEPRKPIYFSQVKSKMMVIENNMFRAPIYEHALPSCDFLIVRTRNSIYIREVSTIFTVGQTMPLVRIPSPTEANIQRFRLDFSNTYIHKLFRNSPSIPPTISFDFLTKQFPDYDPKVLRRRLSMKGAAHQWIEGKSRFNRGTSNFGLVSLKEHRRSFTPELYCLNMSMLAARQRLRELNYSESMIDPPNEVEMEIEVLAAPWNTSKAVQNTHFGRCYLDLKKHLIDPTGPKREGFSCVAWSKSPTEEQQPKKRPGGQTPKEINEIPVKNPLQEKIKREKLERLAIYTREAQLINEVQNAVLSSNEVLSSDDEDEEEDFEEEDIMDNSFDEQLRDLSKLVVCGQTMQELDFEKEETERRELMNDIYNINKSHSSPLKASQDNSQNRPVNVGEFKDKILRITRTYDSEEGEIERTEIVRDPKIIALYVKKKGGPVSPIETNNLESNNGDTNHPSDISTSSNDPKRRSSISLGPKELCRADGIVLTISKRVLNTREMRKHRRDSRARENVCS